MEYSYPIDMDWDKEEVIDIIGFFEMIEKAYEKGVERDLLLASYRRFKEIVPGKAQEKQSFRQFDESANVSCYHTVKKARESESGSIIKM
ncbi:UPF0223 family protein [Bacillus solimangrovi]|uniref:UPF0223 protein BFG57_10510 n=1 Tax=Bacillus solimangrovi TaxID=1305675 RepID=A0A1E5LIM0_9BACI|nr:UPF0223 family protein [Bacillus solimangrovi]OEH93896.1 hypothetical protein BFG57_10510 [Bacillus solimangrovi]